jgi:hypothetical protein
MLRNFYRHVEESHQAVLGYPQEEFCTGKGDERSIEPHTKQIA